MQPKHELRVQCYGAILYRHVAIYCHVLQWRYQVDRRCGPLSIRRLFLACVERHFGYRATVTFETLPSTVTFFVRTEFAGTVSDIQILDENDDLIMSVTPTNVFQQVIVNRDPGQTLIGSIVVTSTSGGDVVIDDFIFVIS